MQGKREGWKGRKVNGGKAKTPDTRVKPVRSKQLWKQEHPLPVTCYVPYKV